MSCGLVLGKFAPLHRGHQYLIETALEENDQVLVMVYHAPDVTPIPLARRIEWIRQLYPRVEIIEAWDGPLEVGHTPELKRMHEEYILRKLAGRRVEAFYSSEFYGEHVSQALGAKDRRVDQERARYPVSGTAVRADPTGFAGMLHPIVRADLVSRVLLLGAPSTGKSTLAEALAQRFNTLWMPEYGRDYWEQHQLKRRLTLHQLDEIALGHREREDQLAPEANRYLFVDTDASTTRHFARYYHGGSTERLDRFTAEQTIRYDLILLCEDDIPYEDTPDRSGEANRSLFQSWIRDDLNERKVPWLGVAGSLQQRIEQVTALLQLHTKYTPMHSRRT